jgi:peptidoglycan/xylan/chitin deacetylase (PgdA/CDA1 family)
VKHCTLSAEQDSTIAEEMVASRAAIRQNIGTEATCLAYPNGAYNERVVQLAEDAEFTYAFTTEKGLVGRRTNHFKVPRISMDDLVVTDSAAALHPPRVRFHLLQAIPR